MKTRMISAAIAIPFGILVLVLNNIHLYRAAIGLLSAGAVFELILTVKYLPHKIISITSLIYAFFVPFVFSVDAFYDYKTLYVLTYLLIMFILLILDSKKIQFEKITCIAFASIFIPFSLSCLLFSIRDFGEHGVFIIVFILTIAWISDAGAYFAGTFFGKHKMAPEISPKKTWEGFAGGIVTAGITAVLLTLGYGLYYSVFESTKELQFNILFMVIIAVLSSFLGVVGDLSASVLKRQFMVKDFGNVMPGHGGILDRFDSVLFVAPFIYYMFMLNFPVITIYQGINP